MGKLTNDLATLIGRHRSKPQLARRLVESGLALVVPETFHTAKVEFVSDNALTVTIPKEGNQVAIAPNWPKPPVHDHGWGNIGDKNVPLERVPEMAAATRFAVEMLDG